MTEHMEFLLLVKSILLYLSVIVCSIRYCTSRLVWPLVRQSYAEPLRTNFWPTAATICRSWPAPMESQWHKKNLMSIVRKWPASPQPGEVRWIWSVPSSKKILMHREMTKCLCHEQQLKYSIHRSAKIFFIKLENLDISLLARLKRQWNNANIVQAHIIWLCSFQGWVAGHCSGLRSHHRGCARRGPCGGGQGGPWTP